jgi:hypothetical protein
MAKSTFTAKLASRKRWYFNQLQPACRKTSSERATCFRQLSAFPAQPAQAELPRFVGQFEGHSVRGPCLQLIPGSFIR